MKYPNEKLHFLREKKNIFEFSGAERHRIVFLDREERSVANFTKSL